MLKHFKIGVNYCSYVGATRTPSKRPSQSEQPVLSTLSLRRASQATISSLLHPEQLQQQRFVHPPATTAGHSQLPMSVIADHFMARSSLAAGNTPTELSQQQQHRLTSMYPGHSVPEPTQRPIGTTQPTTLAKQQTTGSTAATSKTKATHGSRTKLASNDKKDVHGRWHLPSVIRANEGLFKLWF